VFGIVRVRKIILVIFLLTAVLFFISIPVAYEYIKSSCIDQVCEGFYNPPPGMKWLELHGLSPETYSFAYITIYTVFGLVCLLAALVLFWKKSDDTMGLLGVFMLSTLGGTFTPIMWGLKVIHPILTILVQLIEAGSMAAFILFFYTFPSGRFEPKWTSYICYLLLVMRIPSFIFPDSSLDIETWSPIIFGFWFCLWIGSLISVQIYRYVFVMNPLEKQQAKWVVFGLVVALIGLFVQTAIFIIYESTLLTDPYKLYLLEIGIHTGMLIIPVALLFAILKHRLWDIDVIVNRTIVYVIMTVFTVAVYILGVWYIGLLFQTNNHLLSSLVATGLVAVLFAPLKEKVQRWINRLMYGENDDPFSVLYKLAQDLENPMNPDAVLQLVVKNIKDALRLPYVSLSIYQSSGVKIVAQEGVSTNNLHHFPLKNQGEDVGVLSLSGRSQGEAFTYSEKKLLDMLVRHTSVIVQGAKISMDIKLLAGDLQQSRERLVLAREEERRKLRNNLHDDLAPRLAALALTSAAAEDMVDSNPHLTKEILGELRSTIRETVTEIRGLVFELRPATLDEMGLIGAIHERINALSVPLKNLQEQGMEKSTINFSLHVPKKLPALPAAVEVAAFRIATEGIVNVIRHSKAKNCSIELIYLDEPELGLKLVIRDDGIGISRIKDKSKTGGIGLSSMRERTNEIGGTFYIETGNGAGTIITAVLPIDTNILGERNEKA
jgi:signal transduction histidine kinase